MLNLAFVCTVWHSDSKAMRSCSLRKDTAAEILSLLPAENPIYTSCVRLKSFRGKAIVSY